MSSSEIDSRQIIENMKIEIVDEPTVDHKVIFDRNITLLLKKDTYKPTSKIISSLTYNFVEP